MEELRNDKSNCKENFIPVAKKPVFGGRKNIYTFAGKGIMERINGKRNGQ